MCCLILVHGHLKNKLRPIDWPHFKEDIVQGLRVNDGSESVLDHLNRYKGHLSSVRDKYEPTKEKYVVVPHLQPWFTDELHQAKMK